jgi:hypothetical protein
MPAAIAAIGLGAAQLGGLRGKPNEEGERVIYLDDRVADRLATMRQPGEIYSDVIIRLAARERG